MFYESSKKYIDFIGTTYPRNCMDKVDVRVVNVDRNIIILKKKILLQLIAI